jgi:hypothetical protein
VRVLAEVDDMGYRMTVNLAQTGLDSVLMTEGAPITAAEFRERVRARVGAGVEQAGDAFAFSRHSDGFTYGVDRWRFVLAEMGLAFADIEGVSTLSSGGMRVTVLPVGDNRTVLIYPLCFADDAHTPAQFVRVRPSRLRKLLFASRAASREGLQLVLPGMGPHTASVTAGEDDPEAVSEDAAAQEIEAAITELPQMPQTIIVGYASNPDGGLLQLIIGEASMDADGTLIFSWIERLPIGDTTPALYPVSGTEEDRFDAEPEPGYEVIVREEDEPEDGADD